MYKRQEIDIYAGLIDLKVSDEEISLRLSKLEPLKKDTANYLKRYSHFISSSNEGAIYK